MIIWQPQQDELRHCVFTRLTFSHKFIEFIQKLICTQLVGIGNLKVGKQGIEVAPKFGLRRHILGKNRYRPGIGAWAAPRVSDILFETLAFLNKRS